MRIRTGTVLTTLLLFHATQAQERASDVVEPLHVTQVYADSTGTSHFADQDLPMAIVDLDGATHPMAASTLMAVASLSFSCFAAGTVVDWHAAPRRQFYLILSGELQMEVSDGEVRRFRAGSVILGEASRGPGVRASWVGTERACVAVVPLDQWIKFFE